MQRRDFLRKGLALGAATMLPGAGLHLAGTPLSAVPVVEPLMPIWEAAVNVLDRLLLVSVQQLKSVLEGNVSMLIRHFEHRKQLWNEFELLDQQLVFHKELSPESPVWRSAEVCIATKAKLNMSMNCMKHIQKNASMYLVTSGSVSGNLASSIRMHVIASNLAHIDTGQPIQQYVPFHPDVDEFGFIALPRTAPNLYQGLLVQILWNDELLFEAIASIIATQ
jgi:hypothetical protein